MEKAKEIAGLKEFIVDAQAALKDVCPEALKEEIKADIREARRQIAALSQ